MFGFLFDMYVDLYLTCMYCMFGFQIVIYHPSTSNNCNKVVPPELLQYFAHPYFAQLPLGIIDQKHINIGTIK